MSLQARQIVVRLNDQWLSRNLAGEAVETLSGSRLRCRRPRSDDPIFDANQDEHPPAGHDINVWPLGLLRESQGDQEMSNTPHTLRDEFPDQMEAIHALKTTSPEFARILDEYDEVNDRVHRAEVRIEPVSEEAEVDLRKQRLMLKDKIASALSRR